MTKKRKEERNLVIIEGIRAFKVLGVAFFEAAAVNPIMATAGGLMPFVLMSMFAPGPAMAGLAGVGAVAGLSNVPNIAVSTPFMDFGLSAAQAKWPAQINIIKKEKATQVSDTKL